MGISVNDLPPWAQAQIARKVLEENRHRKDGESRGETLQEGQAARSPGTSSPPTPLCYPGGTQDQEEPPGDCREREALPHLREV